MKRMLQVFVTVAATVISGAVAFSTVPAAPAPGTPAPVAAPSRPQPAAAPEPAPAAPRRADPMRPPQQWLAAESGKAPQVAQGAALPNSPAPGAFPAQAMPPPPLPPLPPPMGRQEAPGAESRSGGVRQPARPDAAGAVDVVYLGTVSGPAGRLAILARADRVVAVPEGRQEEGIRVLRVSQEEVEIVIDGRKTRVRREG